MSVRYMLFALLLLVLQTVASPTDAAGPALPMAATRYGEVLTRVEGDALRAAVGDKQAGAAAETMLSGYAFAAVHLGGSDLVIADNRPILAQMQTAQSAQTGDAAQDWLGIASELRRIDGNIPLRGADADADMRVEASARTLLSGAAYASEPIPGKSIWDRMMAAIGRWIDRLMRRLHFSGPSKSPEWVSRVVPEVILVVVISIAVGLIVYLSALIVRNRAGRAASVVSESALALTSAERELVASHDYGGLSALAADAAERGDFRAAFRLVFLATLVFLDAEGAIRLDRSKTNWEYLRSLAGHEEIRDVLRPIIRRFDQVWYGLHEAGRSEYDAAVGAFDSVRRLIVGAPAESAARVAAAAEVSR